MKKVVYKKIYENELSHAWYIGTRSQLLKSLNKFINKKAKILDAGCGTGGTIKFLKLNGYTEIYGIDNSQESIKFCKINKLTHIKNGSVNKLPYKNNYFDAVVCMDVLYHEGVYPNVALKEFYRILKRKGISYLQEPAYNFLRSNHDIAIETARRFTKKDIKYLITSKKFIIDKLTYFNTLFFLPIALQRILDGKVVKTNEQSDVYTLAPVLNFLLRNALFVEFHLLNFVNFPFGLSVIAIAHK